MSKGGDCPPPYTQKKWKRLKKILVILFARTKNKIKTNEIQLAN